MRVKHSTQRIRTLRRRRLALALVAAMAAPVAMAQDLPTGASVINGSATIGGNATDMTITQNSQGAIINWGTFNISNGYSVNFAQPNASSVILNRVTGGSSSYIDGVLSANGHVFLVNTSGITFGGGSQVNVGGLVASTLAISDGDFLTGLGNGRYRFSGTGQGTQVRNDGTINSGTGGVALVGPIVFNTGDITASGGNIVAGAGTTVTLDFVGDGLTQVTINGAPTVDSAIVQNRFGTMTADGGKILLRTAATTGGTGGGIYASGFLQARTISNVAGRIELTSAGGPVMLGAPGIFSDANSPYTNGVIDVSGDSSEIGGSVLMSGKGVTLVNDYYQSYYPYSGEASYIDATGGAGGGNVTITSSGDIYALAGTWIDASSSNSGQGNGGNINLFANGGTAALYGYLYAQGGSSGGNGGRVQVIARDDVYQYGGYIDVSARSGNGGQIFLSATTGSILTETLNAYGYVNGGSVVANAATGIAVLGDVYAQGELGNGGSISLVASQGPVYVDGSVFAGGYANGGSVAMTGTAVPNYYGEGLLNSGDPNAVYVGGSIGASGTNGNGGIVTVSGNGAVVVNYGIYANGGQDGGQVRVQANAGDYAGSIDVGGSVEASGANGSGGIISLVAPQGPVHVNGRVDASGGVNGGSITLTGAAAQFYGDGYYYTTDAVYVSGDIDASGYSGNGGNVAINGEGAVVFDGSILADGGVDGGQIRVRANDGVYGGGSILVDGSMDASGGTGNGGLIDAYSTGNTVVYGDMLAWGGTNGGDISVTGAQVYTGSMLAYGSSGLGGSVSVTADDIVLYGSGTYLDVHGETGGGSIDLYARNNLVLSQNASLSADTGGSGYGGSIHLYAGNSLTAYGDLSARGVDGGGSIFTGSGGGINLNGISVDAGTTNGDAGTWTISAPQLTVINGSYQGYVSEGYYAGSSSDIQDNDLNNAFANGTSIVLEATSGSVYFDAPQIVSAFSSPLFLHVNATSSIAGSGFSIASDGAALEMLFNANSAGGNTNSGYIDFSNASLSSNGGLVAMYGQSDLAGGFASGYASGISLAGVDIDSGGGNVVLRGHSTGDDASSTDAGVYLDGTYIYSGGGDVVIHGTGAGDTNGVNASFGSIISDGGDVAITGEGGTYDGIRMYANDIDSGGGDITLFGYGGDAGVDASYTSLFSAGGAIAVHGEGGTGNGVSFDSAIDSGGGNVTMNGYSADAIGLAFGGYYGGIVSNGGDIRLTGVGQTGGVALYAGSGYGNAAFLPSDVGTINSGGGQLMVMGTAYGTDAIGVYIDGMQLVGGAGDVTVDGSAPLGTGIVFANGAGVSTTSGAITLIGEGANFGLDLDFGDGALVTDTGDISLYGYALASNSTAGVRLTGYGLATNGGDITIHGESAGGMGVQLGDSGGFSISSGGGDISVSGYGATTGVLAPYASMYSGGGNIAVHGEGGTGNGVTLSGPVDSEGGDVTMYGYSADAVGLAFGGYGSGIVSDGGDISLTGVGGTIGVSLYVGSYYQGPLYLLPSDVGTINSGGGQLTVTGTAYGADAIGVYNDGMQLIGGAGDVTVDGYAPLGTGILFANGAGISTTTGAITLIGTGANVGLDVADGLFETDSGDISLYGYALATTATAGVRLTGDGLATKGGNITIFGDSAGGTGVQLGDSGGFTIESGGGDISVSGYGATTGVYAPYASMYSGGGNILVHGEGGTGNGVTLSGPIDSEGGDVTMYGFSVDAIGLAFGGYYSGIVSGGGDISLTGIGQTGGVALYAGGYSGYVGFLPSDAGTINSGGGQLIVTGTAQGTGAVGVSIDGMQLIGGAGDVTVDGSAPLGSGLLFLNGAGVSTTSGAISLTGEGAKFGLNLGNGTLSTDTGDITLFGTATATGQGVQIGSGGLETYGGDISIIGYSYSSTGVWVNGGDIASHGGDISISGTSANRAGVQISYGDITSDGGNILINGDGSSSTGLIVSAAGISSGAGALVLTGLGGGFGAGVAINRDSVIAATSGDVLINGFSDTYNGILLDTGTVSTTSGDIVLVGIGGSVGLSLFGGEFSTDSGHIDLRGRGLGAASDGLLIGSGASITTNGGGIELSGEGGSGAGLSLGQGSSVDAGNSLVVLRAGNDGSSDAIRLQGAIHSGVGVNLRPGGVDANGGLTERVADNIALGGTTGFALSGAELAMIDSPELIIGSSLHAGAIQVLAGVSRNGNLTLQNDGGSGGIDIQSALNVGSGTLALSSGGSITQTSAGAITAHSLLANAGGDVLLAAAQNNVAATTLAGSAGGAFQFQDVDTLAIGNVSAIGMDASTNDLSNLGASGIEAGGNVLVRNLAGDLLLNADVTGANIDLVTAGRLQNLAGASLNASGNWRVWASTWDGETRGGLGGSGNLPNLYGCTFQGSCGVTVPGSDNHFIYVQQPTAVVTLDSFTREYGLPNPLLTFRVTGAILGDTATNVASGSATTTATIGSDVGNYPISGIFTSAAGYRIQLVPGTLGITPATLFFTADGALRYLGTPNPPFSGTVTGFRNGDSVQSVFGTDGIWSSPAVLLSPVGFYAVNGGTSAKNYVFSQAPGNATALQIIPLPQLPGTPTQIIRETVDSYVYDRNFGSVPMCALNASLEDQKLASKGDELSTEWSKVRSRPNLTNCFESERRNSCGDF